MILADVIFLLNDIWFEVLRFVVIAALIVLAVFLGYNLRKLTDKIKAFIEAKKLARSEADVEEKEE